MKRFALSLLLMLGIILLCNCASTPDKTDTPEKYKGGLGPQKYLDEYTSYKTGPLPIGWKRLWGYDADLAFYNVVHKSTIVANSTCGQKSYLPPAALKNHLLFDLKERQIISQEKVEMDMREGLHTVVQGRLEGSLIKLDIFVVQIDFCIYDLAYISSLEQYEYCKEDFEKLVAGFHVRRKD